MPRRMLSAVASRFGYGERPSTAARRVGDVEDDRVGFDNSPIHPSASATPMMSGSVEEGTPGAGGFLGASDGTPAPNTCGNGSDGGSAEAASSAVAEDRQLWLQGYTDNAAPAVGGGVKFTASEGVSALVAPVGGDDSVGVVAPMGDAELLASGTRRSREDAAARDDKAGCRDAGAAMHVVEASAATAAASRSIQPPVPLDASDHVSSAPSEAERVAWRVDAARRDACAHSVAVRSLSRRSVSPSCDESATSFYNPMVTVPFNSTSGAPGPVAVSGADPAASRSGEVGGGPKDAVPFNSTSGAPGPVAVFGVAPTASQGGTAGVPGPSTAELNAANVQAAHKAYLHSLIDCGEPASLKKLAKLAGGSSAGSVSSKASVRSSSRNASACSSRHVSERGRVPEQPDVGPVLPSVNAVRAPSAVEMTLARGAAAVTGVGTCGVESSHESSHSVVFDNCAAAVRRAAQESKVGEDRAVPVTPWGGGATVSRSTHDPLERPSYYQTPAPPSLPSGKGELPIDREMYDREVQARLSAAALSGAGVPAAGQKRRLDIGGQDVGPTVLPPYELPTLSRAELVGAAQASAEDAWRLAAASVQPSAPFDPLAVHEAWRARYPSYAAVLDTHGVQLPPTQGVSAAAVDAPRAEAVRVGQVRRSSCRSTVLPKSGDSPTGGVVMRENPARVEASVTAAAAGGGGGGGGGDPPDSPSDPPRGGGGGGGLPPSGPPRGGGDGDRRKRKGSGSAPPDDGGDDDPAASVEVLPKAPPTAPNAGFDMAAIGQLLSNIVEARDSVEARGDKTDDVPKLLRSVPSKLHPHLFLKAPIHLVLKPMPGCLLSQEDVLGALPTTLGGLTRDIDIVAAPTKLLMQFHTQRPLLLREYLEARRNLLRRLVAAVCTCKTLVLAEREAARYLFNAVVAVAAVRSGHNTYAGWSHLRRVRDMFESQCPPAECSVMLASFDTVHAPATPHAAEVMYRHALDPFSMQDSDSLPSIVYAAAVANAHARNSDPEVYVPEARVQFGMWLAERVKSSPEMREILQPISALFKDVRLLESTQAEFNKHLQFAEQPTGEMFIALNTIFQRHASKQHIPHQRPRAMGQVNQVGQVVQVDLDRGDEYDSLIGVCEHQHVQQPNSGSHHSDVLNAIEFLERADRVQSIREASESHNREAPPRRAHKPFVGAVGGEGRRDNAQAQPKDHSRQMYVPQGKQVFSAQWVRDYGCPTLLGEPNDRQRLPLGNPNLRQIYAELNLEIPKPFKDDATIGGDMCACCLARGVKRWFIHPADVCYNGFQKPNEPDCGYVHNIRKCQYLYAAIHIYNRALVDQGKPTADWMCEPRPLPAVAAQRG